MEVAQLVTMHISDLCQGKKIAVLWVEMPCSVAERYWCFRGTCNLQLLTGLHSTAFQNTVILISSDIVISIAAHNKNVET